MVRVTINLTMFTEKKVTFILFITLFFVVCCAERDYFDVKSTTVESNSDYLDPHSFYYDKHTQQEVPPTYDTNIRKFIEGDDGNSCECDGPCNEQLHLCRIALRNRPTNTDIADEILSRRFVNMLLSRTKFKLNRSRFCCYRGKTKLNLKNQQDGKLFTGFVELEATESELESLRNFGEGKLTLREVDPVLNNVMKTPEYDSFYESAIWIHDITLWIWSSISHLMRWVMDYKEIVVSMIFIVWVIRSLRKMRYNLWMILCFGTVMILIASFFITWWKLIQEAEIKHTTLQMQNMKMPVHCQPERMTWWDKLTSSFSNKDECEKYHEAMMKTPFLQVTPAQALSHMLSHVLYEPVELAGKLLRNFAKNATADMPWWCALIMQAIIYAGFLPCMIMFLILAVGGSLNIGGFGPLSLFSLKGPSRSSARRDKSLESKIERRPIEVMLNINVRPQGVEMIESSRAGGSSNLALTDKSENVKEKKDKKKEKKKKKEEKKKKVEISKENENKIDGSKELTIRTDGSGDYKLSDENSEPDDNGSERHSDTPESDDDSSADEKVKTVKSRANENNDR